MILFLLQTASSQYEVLTIQAANVVGIIFTENILITYLTFNEA